jgi:hypothetical protein
MSVLKAPAVAAPDGRAEAQRLAAIGRGALGRGDRLVASDLARAALALDGDCFAAHVLLASLSLDGEHYRSLLERLHGTLMPRTYLEVGVAQGRTLSLARSPTLAIGVDPEPQIGQQLPPHIRIFRETSDSFFANHDLSQEFGGLPVDLAFIDGMHMFEYALRDFIHLERHANPGTSILLHDCYPLDAATSARRRSTTFWTGDVWKLIVCLRKYRPDLEISTLAAPPSGLAVIRRLDPYSVALAANHDALCREFVPLPYEALGANKPAALNLVTGDWPTACELLQS